MFCFIYLLYALLSRVLRPPLNLRKVLRRPPPLTAGPPEDAAGAILSICVFISPICLSYSVNILSNSGSSKGASSAAIAF